MSFTKILMIKNPYKKKQQKKQITLYTMIVAMSINKHLAKLLPNCTFLAEN